MPFCLWNLWYSSLYNKNTTAGRLSPRHSALLRLRHNGGQCHCCRNIPNKFKVNSEIPSWLRNDVVWVS